MANSYGPLIFRILYDIARGLWTAIPEALRRQHFRRFFGRDAVDTGKLILTLDPYSHPTPRSQRIQPRFIKHFHGRCPDTPIIGEDLLVGSCSVRTTQYATRESAKHLPEDRPLRVSLDETVMNDWDGTFICTGSSDSNIKTHDIEQLNEMNLYQHNPNPQAPQCFRMNGQDYVPRQTDRAVLMRMKNPKSPNNYLFVCAGFSEWGTSGSVWYLFRNWKQLHKRFKKKDNFCLMLEVQQNSDESAHELASYTP